MSRPAIQIFKLNEHMGLSQCPPDSECREPNWWLYDYRVGWNIAMREQSERAALVKAIEYWAERAMRYEKKYEELSANAELFVNRFNDLNSD